MDETGDAVDDETLLRAVGSRVRDLRTRASLTLAELAERTGITASTLSRLETGRVQPTLAQLLPLSRAFRIPLGQLVDAPRVGDPRVHLHPVHRFGLTFIPLTQRAGGVQAYKVIYPPAHTLPPPELQRHDGHEWFYVLAGTVRLVLGGEHDLLLGAGEAVDFDTHTPHWIGNPHESTPAEVIAIFGTQGEQMHLHQTGG